jgi:hypothetical protein
MASRLFPRNDSPEVSPPGSPRIPIFEAPIRAKRVYTAGAKRAGAELPQAGVEPPDVDFPQTGVELIKFKDYTAIAKIPDRDHLTNDNWYDWKERFARVVSTCNISGYITGSIVGIMTYRAWTRKRHGSGT